MHEGEVTWTRGKTAGAMAAHLDGEKTPFKCSTCGNENPYVFGEITVNGSSATCGECKDSEEYMNSLIAE